MMQTKNYKCKSNTINVSNLVFIFMQKLALKLYTIIVFARYSGFILQLYADVEWKATTI